MLTYDANGNTLTKSNASGTSQYTWDFENRLTTVTLPGSGGAVTMRYDPFGRRIQKASEYSTTNYLFDEYDIIGELDASGSQVAWYSQSSIIDSPLAMTRAGVTTFFQQDALASITSLSNGAGAITDTYKYDSFGGGTASSGTTNNPLRYAGREFDSETQLYYYRARYYDPAVGHLLNEDRLRFSGGINFYSYVGSNPTNLTDPTGLFANNNNNLQPKPWDFRDIIIYMLNDTNNNECRCWFQTGKRSIAEIIDIISHVPIVFTEAPPFVGGDTTSDPRSPIEINQEGPFYPTSPYNVGHNPDQSPIYPPGSFEAQMVILLHELAHKAMPQGYTSDGRLDDPPDASEKNTSRVIDHCKAEIKFLKFLFNKK